MFYLWVKVIHIVAMTSWFAGLFYLPRLFVYHAETQDLLGQNRFNVMQRKLLHFIMTPAALVTILSGLTLLHMMPIYSHSAWMQGKLFCVLLLILYHGQCYRFVRMFQENKNRYSHRFYRAYNEIPTVLLLVIVILVVVKPT